MARFMLLPPAYIPGLMPAGMGHSQQYDTLKLMADSR